MKSRTLISFSQKPGLNPVQAEIVFTRAKSSDATVAMVMLLMFIDASSQSKKRPGMPGDHDFLIGGNDPCRDFTLRSGDARRFVRVSFGVEFQAEPGSRFADSPPNFWRVLSDAGGEHQAINSSQHCDERPDFLGGTVNEVVHC